MTQLVPTGGLQSTSTSNIFKPKQIWTPLFLIPSINAWVQSFWVTTNPNIIETWYHQNISSCLAWKVIPFLVGCPKRVSSGLFAGLPLITWFGLVVWGFSCAIKPNQAMGWFPSTYCGGARRRTGKTYEEKLQLQKWGKKHTKPKKVAVGDHEKSPIPSQTWELTNMVATTISVERWAYVTRRFWCHPQSPQKE